MVKLHIILGADNDNFLHQTQFPSATSTDTYIRASCPSQMARGHRGSIVYAVVLGFIDRMSVRV